MPCGCKLFSPKVLSDACTHPMHAFLLLPVFHPASLGDAKAGNEPLEQNVKCACIAVEIGGGAPYVITLDA